MIYHNMTYTYIFNFLKYSFSCSGPKRNWYLEFVSAVALQVGRKEFQWGIDPPFEECDMASLVQCKPELDDPVRYWPISSGPASPQLGRWFEIPSRGSHLPITDLGRHAMLPLSGHSSPPTPNLWFLWFQSVVFFVSWL